MFAPSRAFLSLVFAVGHLGLTGCGEDPSSPDLGPGTTPIQLSLAQAAPLAKIEVTGLPEDDTAYVAEVLDAGSEAVLGHASVERDGDGRLLVTAPVHPVTPIAGGSVEIRLTDGDQLTTETASLTLEGLPDGTGSYASVVASLRSILDSQLARYGTTREELRAKPVDQFLPTDYQLFAVQSMLDDPGNPNSMLALAEGPIELFASSDLDLELLESVIVATGFDEHVAQIAQTLTDRAEATSAKASMAIGSMQELDEQMSLAVELAGLISGNSGEVLNDVGLALGVVGVVSGGSTAVAGAALWAVQQAVGVAANLLPSAFDNDATSVNLSPSFFLEDQAGPGQWSNFTVVAVSKGMSLDALVLEGILQGAGLGTSFGQFIEQFGAAGSIGQEMAAFVITEATNAVIQETAGESNIITIDPQSWTVVSTGDPLTRARVVQGTSVDVLGSTQYEPVEAGITQVWFETVPGSFGGQVAFTNEAIEVKELQVTVDPTPVTAETSTDVTFTATVENAVDEDLDWSHTGGGTLTEIDNTTVTLTTPDTPWDEPIVVTAKSTSTTGARGKPGAPERSGSALVSNKDGFMVIEPFSICIEPERTQPYTATVVGFPSDQQDVEWTAERGSFDDNIYTAPSDFGPDTITATSLVDPSVQGQAVARVSSCVCHWAAQVSGAVAELSSGSKAEFNTIPGVVTSIQLDPAVNDVQPPNLMIQVLPALSPGQTGTFEIIGGYVSPTGLTFVNNVEEAITLTVTEHTSTSLSGQLSGPLVAPDPQNPENLLQIQVYAEFRAALGFGSGGEGCPLE